MTLNALLDEQAGADAAARERRTERMEQRVRPTVKRIIEAAAAATGQDRSDFVTTAAYERAVAVLENRLATRLPADRFAAFAAALDEPGRPGERLVDLMGEYERGVDDPVR